MQQTIERIHPCVELQQLAFKLWEMIVNIESNDYRL